MIGESLAELLAIDERKTLEFFFTSLSDVVPKKVDRNELLYHASVLAHCALDSTTQPDEMPCPVDLSHLFDLYVCPGEKYLDLAQLGADALETGGAHCLLHVGFFRDQQVRKHNLDWYRRVGASFFYRAALMQPETETKRREFLLKTSYHFCRWAERYARLSRELRDKPYLLKVPTSLRLQ